VTLLLYAIRYVASWAIDLSWRAITWVCENDHRLQNATDLRQQNSRQQPSSSVDNSLPLCQLLQLRRFGRPAASDVKNFTASA